MTIKEARKTEQYNVLNRICNGTNPPLADIVLSGLSLSRFPSRFLKRVCGRGFHTLIKGVSFSSPTDVGSHNPPPSEPQRPRWHSFPSPIDVKPPKSTPLQGLVSLLAHCLVSTPSGLSLLTYPDRYQD